MDLNQKDSVILTENDVQKLIYEYMNKYINTDFAKSEIQKNINYYNEDNVIDSNYSGRLKKEDESFEQYYEYVKKDLSVLADSDEEIENVIDSDIIIKMFENADIIFIDSTKTKIKFEKDFDYLSEERLVGFDGVKKGHLVELIEKTNDREYKKLLEKVEAVNVDFLMFKISDYRAIVFLNPYYTSVKKKMDIINIEFKKDIKLVVDKKNKSFITDDLPMSYKVMYLDKKQINYLNHLEDDNPTLSLKANNYINIYNIYKNGNE